MSVWPSSFEIHSIGAPAASASVANVCPRLLHGPVLETRRGERRYPDAPAEVREVDDAALGRGEDEQAAVERPGERGERVERPPLEAHRPQRGLGGRLAALASCAVRSSLAGRRSTRWPPPRPARVQPLSRAREPQSL